MIDIKNNFQVQAAKRPYELDIWNLPLIYQSHSNNSFNVIERSDCPARLHQKKAEKTGLTEDDINGTIKEMRAEKNK